MIFAMFSDDVADSTIASVLNQEVKFYAAQMDAKNDFINSEMSQCGCTKYKLNINTLVTLLDQSHYWTVNNCCVACFTVISNTVCTSVQVVSRVNSFS